MREIVTKLKNCFWGEYLIGTILFGLLTLSLIVLAVSSGIKLNNAKSEATEYFHCDEVVFSALTQTKPVQSRSATMSKREITPATDRCLKHTNTTTRRRNGTLCKKTTVLLSQFPSRLESSVVF